MADDTNDAVDDIVAGLITGRPNFWTADNQSILGLRSADNSGPCQLNQKEYICNSLDVLIFYYLKLLQENFK